MDYSTFIPALVAILIAITVHEFSHAWMAHYLGDPTAKLEGRLSLNPLVHIDPLGFLMLIFVHFGWAKPVPYNPHYLKNPRSGSLLIALAGPISNFILALVFSIPLKYISPDSIFIDFFLLSVYINLGLMIFNLIPIPPLDGSKILAFFIPPRFDRQLESFLRNGPYVLFGIIILEQVFRIGIISPIIIGLIQKMALLLGIMS
jgi:Zn-dependent protease